MIERGQERIGSRCTQCGFIFGGPVDRCVYANALTLNGLNVAEEAIRLNQLQGAGIELVAPERWENLRE